MTLLHRIRHFSVLALIVVICFTHFNIFAASPEELDEKRIAVAMRMIGHEILLSLDDCSSRVLPVEKEDNVYIVSFEKAFGFDPSTIAVIVERVMAENRIQRDYVVEIKQCESKETVHSFIIRSALDSDLVPCAGRAVPEDCYQLMVTFLDGEMNGDQVFALSENAALLEDNPSDNKSLMYGLLLAVFTSLGAGAWYYKAQRKETNLIALGALQYDEKNMTLLHGEDITTLSHKEAALLSLLYASVNEPIERDEILKKVWGDEGDYIGRTLDVFISKLRKKLEPDPSLKIVNIRSVGYKLVIED